MVNKTKEEIETCLKYYIPSKYWNLNDWEMIIKRVEEVEKGIFKFKCSFFNLYFDSDMHPVTYGEMIVCESKDYRVYYDFEKYLPYRTEPPIPLGEYYWENQSDWGD